MKIVTYEDWKEWNITEKDFMLSLMSIQRKIDSVEEAMRSNIDHHNRTIGNSKDVSEYEEYIETIEKHIPALHKQVRILDEILEDI